MRCVGGAGAESRPPPSPDSKENRVSNLAQSTAIGRDAAALNQWGGARAGRERLSGRARREGRAPGAPAKGAGSGSPPRTAQNGREPLLPPLLEGPNAVVQGTIVQNMSFIAGRFKHFQSFYISPKIGNYCKQCLCLFPATRALFSPPNTEKDRNRHVVLHRGSRPNERGSSVCPEHILPFRFCFSGSSVRGLRRSRGLPTLYYCRGRRFPMGPG